MGPKKPKKNKNFQTKIEFFFSFSFSIGDKQPTKTYSRQTKTTHKKFKLKMNSKTWKKNVCRQWKWKKKRTEIENRNPIIIHYWINQSKKNERDLHMPYTDNKKYKQTKKILATNTVYVRCTNGIFFNKQHFQIQTQNCILLLLLLRCRCCRHFL